VDATRLIEIDCGLQRGRGFAEVAHEFPVRASWRRCRARTHYFAPQLYVMPRLAATFQPHLDGGV
jgi:hypothetical protein